MVDHKPLDIAETAPTDCADRIGMARLAKIAFDGGDLRPMWAELIAKLLDGTADAGEGLDLSLIAQLLGRQAELGLSIQHEVLAVASAVPLCLARRTARGCGFWRWRRQPTWAATRRSNSCWRTPGSS